MSKASDAILVHLGNGNKVVRRGKHGWKWTAKNANNPALSDTSTSLLFRADLVEEIDGELMLTAIGKIIAKK